MYLRAWNTQENIANELKVSRERISDIIGKFLQMQKNTKDFNPFIYNVWNTPKGNETKQFDSFQKTDLEAHI